MNETVRQLLLLRRYNLMAENRRIEDEKRRLSHEIVTSPTFDPFGPDTVNDRGLDSLMHQQAEITAQLMDVDRQLSGR